MDAEWDQRLASSRSIETMRRIAQDASRLGDDATAFHAHAARHQLTANEVVYYLNAYEYGGEAGLQAIRNPDIILPDVARHAIKTITALLDERFSGQPPCRITEEGTAIGIYEVQQRQNGDVYLFPICQLRLTLATRQWHLYWMRAFDAWWPYSLPDRGHKYALKARVQQVLDDEHGCFWG
ncbi:MAG: DUF3024 domain-containing protein [Chloroflexi bacterium]|nr:DUF3024 domain-containing protein [Chloroflexota bacterium]MBU1748178.1 DUF3024 domain-containing protein [Chloroflexota bacterium]MBU1878382.1 DUF3024 domain-containing protein [Chloroflexota bacterium]